MRALTCLVASAALLGSACPRSAGGRRDGDGSVDTGPRRPEREPAKIPDREESQRRQEAVRRAVEEVALRGVDTREYLINLIVEGDSYRVAFVKRSGANLEAEVRVKVRREDFEILSIEGIPDGGG